MLMCLYRCTTIFTNFSFILVPVAELTRPICPFGRQCTEEIFPVLAIKPVLPSFFVSRGELPGELFSFLFLHMPLYAGVQFTRLIFSILILHLLREINCINRHSNRAYIIILLTLLRAQLAKRKTKVKALKIKAVKNMQLMINCA